MQDLIKRMPERGAVSRAVLERESGRAVVNQTYSKGYLWTEGDGDGLKLSRRGRLIKRALA